MATDTLTKLNPEEARAQRMADALEEFRKIQPAKAKSLETPKNTAPAASEPQPTVRAVAETTAPAGISETRARGGETTPTTTASQDVISSITASSNTPPITVSDIKPSPIASVVAAANLDPSPEKPQAKQSNSTTVAAADAVNSPANVSSSAAPLSEEEMKRVQRAKKLTIDTYTAQATDAKTKKISPEAQAVLEAKIKLLEGVSDAQFLERTNTLLNYADKNRSSLRDFAQKSLEDLKAGNFEVHDTKIKPIEDKAALARIEAHSATEEDKQKYNAYITAFEDASKLLESANKGTDQEIIARAAKIDALAQQEKDEKFFAGAAKAAGLISPELSAVIEMLSPWLAKMMGEKPSIDQNLVYEIDKIPDGINASNTQGLPQATTNTSAQPNVAAAEPNAVAADTAAAPATSSVAADTTSKTPNARDEAPIIVAANDTPSAKSAGGSVSQEAPTSDYSLASPTGGTGLKLKENNLGGFSKYGFDLPKPASSLKLSGSFDGTDVPPPPPAAQAASAAAGKTR